MQLKSMIPYRLSLGVIPMVGSGYGTVTIDVYWSNLDDSSSRVEKLKITRTRAFQNGKKGHKSHVFI